MSWIFWKLYRVDISYREYINKICKNKFIKAWNDSHARNARSYTWKYDTVHHEIVDITMDQLWRQISSFNFSKMSNKCYIQVVGCWSCPPFFSYIISNVCRWNNKNVTMILEFSKGLCIYEMRRWEVHCSLLICWWYIG